MKIMKRKTARGAQAGESKTDVAREKTRSGGRNLVILGVVSVGLALLTTGTALIIYKKSGDIYLDRSRPGYLPDEEEIKDEEEKKEEYVFEKTGEMTMEVLEEYEKELDEVVKEIDGYNEAFSQDALTDEELGI